MKRLVMMAALAAALAVPAAKSQTNGWATGISVTQTAVRVRINNISVTTLPDGKVAVALQRLADEKGDKFSWVFVDPPYAAGEVEPVLALLSGGKVLDSGAVVIVEHDRHNLPPEKVGALEMVDRRFYGDTGVSFYRCQRELT